MKWLVVLLVALAAAEGFSPGCDVCLRGHCLARAEFYPGADAIVSPKATIDYENNIMYIIDKTGKAIHLDDKKINPVPMGSEQSRLFELSVDRASGDVYYVNVYDHKTYVYRYQPNTNVTTRLENEMLTNRGITGMWVHDRIVYFSDAGDYGVHYISGSSIENMNTFTHELIKNIAFDKNGHMYVSALQSVKRLKKNEANAVDVTNKSYVLTSDKNGEVYFFNTWRNMIYQLDSTTDQLEEIGAYDISNYINKVIFDKYGNMISLHVTNKKPFIESWYYLKATADQCSYKIVDNMPQVTKL